MRRVKYLVLPVNAHGGRWPGYDAQAGVPSAREIDRLTAEQTDRRSVIWLHVRVGGQRMTAVAKKYGYSDGSGVYRVIQRLEGRAKKSRQRDRQLKSLARQMLDGIKNV